MNQLATILVLVLSSSNASKFLQPIHQFQQELDSKESDPELNSVYYEDGAIGRGEGGSSKLTPLGGLQGWDSAPDPRMYVLTELEGPHLPGGYNEADLRVKRKGPSLSIVNPLDVLRQRLLIEMARRQKAESMGKIQRNRELLSKVGKRSIAMPKSNDDELDNNEERYKSQTQDNSRTEQQAQTEVLTQWHPHGMSMQT